MAEVESIDKDVELQYPEAGMESPQGKEKPMPPAWREVYGGSKFDVRSLFPPFTWLPATMSDSSGPAVQLRETPKRMGELPYNVGPPWAPQLCFLVYKPQ
jgi:hypothetical protein